MTIPSFILVLLSIPIIIESIRQRNPVYIVSSLILASLYAYIALFDPSIYLARSIARFTLAFILGALDGEIIWRHIKHANSK